MFSNNNDSLYPQFTSRWEMRSANSIQDRVRYTVTSHIAQKELSPLLATEAMHSEAFNRHLQLPAGYNPLTLQWAQQLRRQTTNPAQLAQLALQFFHQQPFSYTLSPPPLGRNQVDDFLFGTQAGFCEHYASAFVVIMRASGIPARIVTGYQGGEINPIDGLMTIRQSDAHAWAEIWLDSSGWVRVDPTAAVAPNRIEHGINSSFPDRNFSNFIRFNQNSWLGDFARQLRAQWDATNSAWNLWVLNYSLDKQKNLLSSLTGIEHPQAAQLGIAMMVAAGLIVSILSLILVDKKNKISPLDKIYLTFCQRMSQQGWPRLPHEGARDYGQRLQTIFRTRSELTHFLALYNRCKYGKGYNPRQFAHLKKLLKSCLRPENRKQMCCR
jgi:transglutaminase-like putative cysteine protease